MAVEILLTFYAALGSLTVLIYNFCNYQAFRYFHDAQISSPDLIIQLCTENQKVSIPVKVQFKTTNQPPIKTIPIYVYISKPNTEKIQFPVLLNQKCTNSYEGLISWERIRQYIQPDIESKTFVRLNLTLCLHPPIGDVTHHSNLDILIPS